MAFDLRIEKRLGARRIATAFAGNDRVVALVGPSGAGKTTVLNCIAGMLKPESGHIMVGGETLFDSARRIDIAPDLRRCGYVFQDSRLFPHRTVAQNLAYGMALAPRAEQWIGRDEVISMLDIGDLLDCRPATLSGGETRRVAIGRALLSAPRFLLLDEPLASLDPQRAEQVMQAIERIRDSLNLPILYVSHDRAEVARLTTRVAELDPAF